MFPVVELICRHLQYGFAVSFQHLHRVLQSEKSLSVIEVTTTVCNGLSNTSLSSCTKSCRTRSAIAPVSKLKFAWSGGGWNTETYVRTLHDKT